MICQKLTSLYLEIWHLRSEFALSKSVVLLAMNSSMPDGSFIVEFMPQWSLCESQKFLNFVSITSEDSARPLSIWFRNRKMLCTLKYYFNTIVRVQTTPMQITPNGETLNEIYMLQLCTNVFHIFWKLFIVYVRTVARKSSIEGLYVCAERLTVSKWKNSTLS